MTAPYQFLPALTDDEFAALKANIEQRGVIQPVVVDEAGIVIDGHHRARACDELGIDYPRVVLEGMSDDEKVEQALVLNLGRRHLTRDQKRDLVVRLRDAGRTERWIATATGIPKSTVHRYLDPAPNGATLDELAVLEDLIEDGLADIDVNAALLGMTRIELLALFFDHFAGSGIDPKEVVFNILLQLRGDADDFAAYIAEREPVT